MNILYIVHDGEKVVLAPQPFLGNSVSTGHTVTFKMSMGDMVEYMKQNNVSPQFDLPMEVDEKLYKDHFIIEDNMVEIDQLDENGEKVKIFTNRKAVDFLEQTV